MVNKLRINRWVLLKGKEKLFGFFVGKAMQASGGKANTQFINELLKKKL